MLTVLLAVNLWMPEISFLDSKDDAKSVFLVVDDCTFKMAKTKRYDIKYIEKMIDEKCGFKIKLSDYYENQ